MESILILLDYFSNDVFSVVVIISFDCGSYSFKRKEGSNWLEGKDFFGNLDGRECFY